MLKIMQHCFGKDNSGGPINAFNRLLENSKYTYSKIRQLEPAGGFNKKLISEFVNQMKLEQPQLIHIRGLGNEGFHAALAAKIAGVPNILVSIHGTHRDLVADFHPFKKWIVVNILEKITLAIATDIVTVCDFAQKRSFLNPYYKKVRNPISNGVPIPKLIDKVEVIELRKKFSIDENSLVGICVSRINVEKGYLVLANALKKIDKKENKFVLLIVGGGDEDGFISSSYLGLKFIEVKFIGHVANVGEYLSISNFFIFPTFHENLSNALIEAMSYQLPVIATSVGGNTEVVKKGGGLLIEPNNVESLALSVKRFLHNPELMLELGLEARKNIINNYSVTKMVVAWESLYCNILGIKDE